MSESPLNDFIEEGRLIINDVYSKLIDLAASDDDCQRALTLSVFQEKLIALKNISPEQTKHLDLSLLLKERELYMKNASRDRQQLFEKNNTISNQTKEIEHLKAELNKVIGIMGTH